MLYNVSLFAGSKEFLEVFGNNRSSNWQTVWSKNEFFRGNWVDDLLFGENFMQVSVRIPTFSAMKE